MATLQAVWIVFAVAAYQLATSPLRLLAAAVVKKPARIAALLLVMALTGCGGQDKESDRAFEEGRVAGAAGLSANLNPYPPSSQVPDLAVDRLRVRWFSGHNSGVALRLTAQATEQPK